MIYYNIHKLGIYDQHGEFYQEGLTALWESYRKYGDHPTFPRLATMYIRSRLIDLIRKSNRVQDRETIYEYIHDQPELNQQIENFDPSFWNTVRSHLTEKQWIYVVKRIVEGKAIKEIAHEEQVTVDAVKGWGKEVKKKLRPIMIDFL